MTKAPKIVALLPMKANSVRVKGKNFRDFCGKPLYRWMLDTLLSIEKIDLIVINTDARLILEETGLLDDDRIIIRDRSADLCGDDVSMNLILADDLINVPADFYLMTHTTNPLLSAGVIYDAINQYESAANEGLADSLFTVNKVQGRFYKSDCAPVNHDPNNLIPTQNLEPWFLENSNLYIFTANSFAKTKARIGSMPMMYETPALESFDIDTPDDWEFAAIAAMSKQEKFQ